MSPTGFEAAIVDLDGTVYRGDQLVPGARRGIEALREAGVDVLFLTNKAIERRESYAGKLSRLGIPTTVERVVSSGWVAANYLAEHHAHSEVLVVGEPPLVEELEHAGIEATRDAPGELVLASMDRQFDYETLTLALRTIEDDVPFIATNPDRTCPTTDGVVPDAAGMIAAIEAVTGRELDRIVGKPSETMVETALETVDAAPGNCLMVGDRLETDVEMGERAGMTTVLVRSGVTDEASLHDADVEPDHVLDSLGDVGALLDGTSATPPG